MRDSRMSQLTEMMSKVDEEERRKVMLRGHSLYQYKKVFAYVLVIDFAINLQSETA